MDQGSALQLGEREVPGSADVHLSLPAHAENVAHVRQLVGSIAETLDFPPQLCEDVRLAVTEACTNVVRHAYRDGRRGALEVEVARVERGLQVVVSDHGVGITPDPANAGAGLGLPLIAALATELEIEQPDDHGSRLRMCFTPVTGTLRAA